MKKEVLIKQEKTFCDICGQEMGKETLVIKDFKIFECCLNFPEKYYSISAIAEMGSTKKDICFDCINKKINESLDELYKK